MKILGIDPGTALTGYAVLEFNKDQSQIHLLDFSCIKTPAGMPLPQRLHVIHKHLHAIMDYSTPEIIAVEKLFFNNNAKTAMSVGQARGVPLLVSAEREILFAEYTALQAKKLITGYGRASKKEMQTAVQNLFRLNQPIKPDDANDAVAMALCYIANEFDVALDKLEMLASFSA